MLKLNITAPSFIEWARGCNMRALLLVSFFTCPDWPDVADNIAQLSSTHCTGNTDRIMTGRYYGARYLLHATFIEKEMYGETRIIMAYFQLQFSNTYLIVHRRISCFFFINWKLLICHLKINTFITGLHTKANENSVY